AGFGPPLCLSGEAMPGPSGRRRGAAEDFQNRHAFATPARPVRGYAVREGGGCDPTREGWGCVTPPRRPCLRVRPEGFGSAVWAIPETLPQNDVSRCNIRFPQGEPERAWSALCVRRRSRHPSQKARRKQEVTCSPSI